jgi:hypothetical protein
MEVWTPSWGNKLTGFPQTHMEGGLGSLPMAMQDELLAPTDRPTYE